MAAGTGRLVGRLALVTGGGSGIGRAVCQALAAQGSKVAVVDINEAPANETLQSLSCDQGLQHLAFGCDVSSTQSVSRLLTDVTQRFSCAPCITVNCAGITKDEFLLKMDNRMFDQVIKVNLKGTFLITQAVGRAMVEGKIQNGSIINMASIVGKVGNLGQCNYAASKAGVEGLTRTSAKELAKFGIRCNAVLPGFIETPMTDAVPQKVLDKFRDVIPMGRLGKPTDIADVCVFLASEESSYITGASIEVTGGLNM
ncbi:estradiol 17-beta-dehydrogenase 8-like [Branchiostoma floridae x Branchiostoma japonicum]